MIISWYQKFGNAMRSWKKSRIDSLLKPTTRSQRGFTLMEVMVAVSIFAIVVTVGIGALLTINNNYRKAQTSREAIDSLTYILESMSRGLRTAQEWDSNNSYDGTPSSTFSFIDQNGALITYALNNEAITMTIDTGSAPASVLTSGAYQLNPANVSIDRLIFTAFSNQGLQPYLQINIMGTVASGQATSQFAFQTAVSKR